MSEIYEVSQNECMILPYFVPSVDPIHPVCVTRTTQITCNINQTGCIM
jgi:hypothetical protein